MPSKEADLCKIADCSLQKAKRASTKKLGQYAKRQEFISRRDVVYL